jgi:hypothetical protein
VAIVHGRKGLCAALPEGKEVGALERIKEGVGMPWCSLTRSRPHAGTHVLAEAGGVSRRRQWLARWL